MGTLAHSDGRAAQRRSEVRAVIAMSIPVVLTNSARALMDVADYILVTRLQDTAAQAAILSAQLIVWTYMVIPMGIVAVVNTFVSQALGRKEHRECGRYAWQVCYLSAVFGVLGLALIPALPSIVAAIGHAPEVQAAELVYARIAILGTAPTVLSMGLGWFFVGIHRPWIATWTVIESNIVNVAVAYVLMFGAFGIEPMGIAGAAWGTIVAVVYRSVRLIVAMLRPRIADTFACRETWRLSRKHQLDLWRVGTPVGLQWVCDVGVWAIFVTMLIGNQFGTAALVATNTAWQYMRIAFLPAIGVGQGLQALVGKSIGAGDPLRAVRETRLAVRLTLVYMGTLSLLYAFQGDRLVGWFSGDREVIALGAKIMVCTAVFQLFDGIAITYNSALRGAGDTFVPSIFFIVANWVVIIGGGWAMATWFPELGALGPWIAGATLIALAGVFLWWRWQAGAWQGIRLHGAAGSDAPAGGTGIAEPVIAAAQA